MSDPHAFTTRSGFAAGMTARQLRNTGAEALFHGARAQGFDTLSAHGRASMLLPVMDPDDVFSHTTAATLWGMPLPPQYTRSEVLHISRSDPDRRMRRPGVVSHRISVHSVVRLGGVPVCSPEEAWIHLGALWAAQGLQFGAWPASFWLTAAADFLVTGLRQRGVRDNSLSTTGTLRAAIDRCSPRRGRSLLDHSLDDVRQGVDSPMETMLRLALMEAGLPEPLVDHAIPTTSGVTLHADLAYPRWKIALEYEGDGHRTDRWQWRADIGRVRAFDQLGWRTIRVTGDDASARFAPVIHHLRTITRSSGAN